ncbi:hypothetical protein F5887DRAFT_926009 [Amanita rubescens]|nr:hypothetical protein F5887DRAFT_926009 [Amanita rubescens]
MERRWTVGTGCCILGSHADETSAMGDETPLGDGDGWRAGRGTVKTWGHGDRAIVEGKGGEELRRTCVASWDEQAAERMEPSNTPSESIHARLFRILEGISPSCWVMRTDGPFGGEEQLGGERHVRANGTRISLGRCDSDVRYGCEGMMSQTQPVRLGMERRESHSPSSTSALKVER